MFTSIFNYYLIALNAALIGFMLFFVIVVSPVVFKALSQDTAARFLRAVFPRLFLAGLFISLAMVMLSLFGKERDLILISCVITAGFAINYFILTPKINKARDAVLSGDKQMEKPFKIIGTGLFGSNSSPMIVILQIFVVEQLFIDILF